MAKSTTTTPIHLSEGGMFLAKLRVRFFCLYFSGNLWGMWEHCEKFHQMTIAHCFYRLFSMCVILVIFLSFQDKWLIGLEIGGCRSVIMLNLLFPIIRRWRRDRVTCLDLIFQVTRDQSSKKWATWFSGPSAHSCKFSVHISFCLGIFLVPQPNRPQFRRVFRLILFLHWNISTLFQCTRSDLRVVLLKAT